MLVIYVAVSEEVGHYFHQLFSLLIFSFVYVCISPSAVLIIAGYAICNVDAMIVLLMMQIVPALQ